MSEIETLLLQKLNELSLLPEAQSRALSELVSQQSTVLDRQSREVQTLCKLVSKLSEHVELLTKRLSH